MYMGKLAIRTSNFQLSFRLIQELRARNLDFDVYEITEKLPSSDMIWFAESSEIIENPSIGRPIPTNIENIEQSVELALVLSKGLENPKQLVIGIDPGPYPGMSWLVDGAFVGVAQLESIEYIFPKIKSLYDAIKSQQLLVRVGDGDPLIRDRIINICLGKNWNVELVDESKTSKGLLRHNHSISALRIASMSGVRVWEIRIIKPSTGQIKEIQRQSRKLSKGKFTISYQKAEEVAKGKITLSQSIGLEDYSSSEL